MLTRAQRERTDITLSARDIHCGRTGHSSGVMNSQFSKVSGDPACFHFPQHQPSLLSHSLHKVKDFALSAVTATRTTREAAKTTTTATDKRESSRLSDVVGVPALGIQWDQIANCSSGWTTLLGAFTIDVKAPAWAVPLPVPYIRRSGA